MATTQVNSGTEKYVSIMTKFNISPTAARVYIALLDIGKSTADKIAKKVGTYKANTYDALERLIDAGLATYIIEGKKRFYLPTNPEKLIANAEQTKQAAVDKYDALKEDITKIMPELTARFNSVKEKELFEVYRGRKGFKAMIQDILKESPEHWKGFGNLQVQEYFPYDFPKWFRKTRFRLFSVKSGTFIKRLNEAQKTTKVDVIYLPEELQQQVVWTLFGDNLLIIIYEPDVIVFRIKSKQVVKTFSAQFEHLWGKYKSGK